MTDQPPLTDEEGAENERRWAATVSAWDRTDQPPLTDEKLVEIQQAIDRWKAHPRANGMVPESLMFWAERLIANLRAERARAEKAETAMKRLDSLLSQNITVGRERAAEIQRLRNEVERIAEAHYDTEFDAVELQAEVERLRAGQELRRKSLESLREILERISTIGNETWKTPGHPMNEWVPKDRIQQLGKKGLEILNDEEGR